MADPFDALRAPVTPVDPDPVFAARLRARLARALSLPRGVAVSDTTALPPATAGGPPADTAASGAAIPYLAVRDGRRAADWYVQVLGGRMLGEPLLMADGRLGHAEIAFPHGRIYLADEFPELGVRAPEPDRVPVSLVLTVPDVDATVRAAVDAGGRVAREPSEGHGHRSVTLLDPFGHRWLVQTPLAGRPAAPTLVHGDLVYGSIWVPDAGRAVDFYRSVLGWSVAARDNPDSWQVEGTSPVLGIRGGNPRGELFCCWAVDDIDTAVAWVRAAGGTAGEPQHEPFGVVADCTDDQGMAFAMFQRVAGADRPAVHGVREGDLTYLTLEVVDAVRARAFYGTVLGWRFHPGQITDGWQVDGPAPMTGLWGGHHDATAVPMWRVDDITDAVNRVRRAGGTATDPRYAPYGLASDCTDDQGTRFYLGQLN